MVDAAIERIANEQLARQGLAREPEHEHESSEELDLALYESPRSNKPTRLRWKGLDVSDEFRSYAERIARGEELPPFEGRVLAEPDVPFPWGEPATGEPAKQAGRGSRIALWSSAAVVIALLGWSLAARLEGPALVAPGDTPSAATSAELPIAPVNAVPHDVVESAPVDHETPATAGTAKPGAVEPAALASPLEPASAAASVVHAAVAGAPNAEAAVSTPVTPVEPARAPTANTSANVAPTNGGTVAARATDTMASESPPAAAKATPDEDFGILAPAESAPATSTATTPAAAKSPLRIVGDLARAGQPVPGAVRKEPGSESSAKGSLLVETPSF